MKALTVQKPSGRHWKPFRRVSWKPVFVQDFPIYRPFSASCSPGNAYRISAAVQLLISMVKDTSLAANITVTEMFMVTQRIVARTYEPLLLYLEVGLIYLIFSTVLTKLQAVGEKTRFLRTESESDLCWKSEIFINPLAVLLS